MVGETETHWQRLWRLHDEAAERLSDADRSAYLGRLHESDPDIAGEVQRLLAVQERAERFMASPPSVVIAARQEGQSSTEFTTPGAVGDPLIGRDVAGRYTIESLVGRGGMGAVYAAMQRSPRKRIALKVMRGGAMDARALGRMRLEAEALARLHHPGIAQVFESGTFDVGEGMHAFVAMELVAGPTLSEFLRECDPLLAERVAMLADVCDAVEHAHQRGVIHCDLKPANILVDAETGDSQRQVKVVDFGVSRIIGGEDLSITLARDVHELAGTLAYMGPERLAADAAPPTIATDVYALGVIGYEMLANRLPVKVEATSVLLAIQAHLTATPRPLGECDARLRGDLETIIHRAIEREPARRFGSAGEFAADLRRWLGREPIHSRPASPWYRAKRLVQRNKALSVVIAAATLGLLGASVVSTVQAIRATRQQRLAERHFRDAWNAGRFMVFDLDGLLVNVPNTAPARAANVEQGVNLLDRLQESGNLSRELQADVTRAYIALMRVLGVPNRSSIGDVPGALRMSEKALASVRALLDHDPTARDARHLLAMIHSDRGLMLTRMHRTGEGCAEYRLVLDTFEPLLREDPGDWRMFTEFGRYSNTMMPAQFTMPPPHDSEQQDLVARIAKLVLIPAWRTDEAKSFEDAAVRIEAMMYKYRVLGQTGHQAEGEAGLLQLASEAEQTLDRFGDRDQLLLATGDAYRLVGQLQQADARPLEAMASFDRALHFYGRCTPATRITLTAGLVGTLHASKAKMMFELGRHQDAVAEVAHAQQAVLAAVKDDYNNSYIVRLSINLATSTAEVVHGSTIQDVAVRCDALRKVRDWLAQSLQRAEHLGAVAQSEMQQVLADAQQGLAVLDAGLAECD